MNQLSPRLTLTVLLTLISSLIYTQETKAQITPDNSLGTENSTVRQDNINNLPSDVIEGGASRGSNLFHSFQEFNVREGRGAYFGNLDVIRNIFTRVTGGNVSNILGTLGVLGNANLYLINPNGIMFGPNARLDMRGAFVGSTADSLIFNNNFEFSASNPDILPLLTVDIPIGLRFRQQSATINSSANLSTPNNLTLQGGNLNLTGSIIAGGDLTLEAQNNLTIRDTIENPFIAVSGKDLLIQGNNIDIFILNNPNSAIASYGNLTLKSPNPVIGDAHYWGGGNFRIENLDSSLGNLQSIKDPVIHTGGDVSIGAYEGASLHIIAGGSVTIPNYLLINSADAEYGLQETITLSNGQQINIDGKNNPTLDIRAGVSPEFIGEPFLEGIGSFIEPLEFPDNPSSADINVGTIIFRNAEDINEKITGNVFLTNQYQPNLNLQGNITTNASIYNPNLELDNVAIETGNNNNGGMVVIDSKRNVDIDGRILAKSSNFGGEVTINSTDTVSLTNTNTNSDEITEINVRSSGGGNININTNNLTMSGGTNRIRAGIDEGLGNPQAQGGDININATGIVTLEGDSFISNWLTNSSQGNAGNTYIKADSILANAGGITSNVDTNAQGNGGNIFIDTKSLTLENGGNISANTFGIGNAGTINITATEGMTLNNGYISNNVENAGAGNTGGITIDTSTLTLENGAKITTDIFGKGNAGDININSNSLDIINSSLIRSTIFSGEGERNTGKIKIDAGSITILGDSGIGSTVGDGQLGNSRGIEINTNTLDLVNGNIVSSVGGTGNSGDININANQTINLLEDSKIWSQNSGTGSAGAINLMAKDSIKLQGIDTIVSEINSSVTEGGNAGKITINTGSLDITTGIIWSQVNFGAIGDSLGIEINTNSLNLNNYLSNISTVNWGSGKAGDITINANGGQVKLSEGGGISSQINGSGRGGNISITANSLEISSINTSLDSLIQSNADSIYTQGVSGKIKIDTGSLIINHGYISNRIGGDSIGNSQGIEIKTNSLLLENGAYLNSSTEGKGNAGLIDITANDGMTLRGENQGKPSYISSQVNSTPNITAEGNSEGITINTSNLTLEDGAYINASTFGKGNAGIINITATDITLKGINNLGIPSSIESMIGLNGEGYSNGIIIDTNTLSLEEGAFITTSTFGQGNAGNINITARVQVSISGTYFDTLSNRNFGGILAYTITTGEAGDIAINTPIFNISEGAGVEAFTQGEGDAGSITINSPQIVNLGKDSQIVVETSAAGKPGQINLTTDTLNIGTDAQLSATATKDSTNLQGGGSINLNTQNLNIAGRLGIFAETQGETPAGNLTINPNDNNSNLNIQFTDNGFISARTTSIGDGGSITLTAPENIDISGLGSITAETSGEGNAGNINIVTENLTIREGVEIRANTSNLGDSGNITLSVLNLNLDNATIEALTTNQGNPGSILISNSGNQANQVNLGNNSTISTEINGEGDRENAQSANITLNSDNLNLDNSKITASTNANRDAGEITVNANNLTTTNQSNIETNTSSSGNAGDIILNLQDNLSLNNSKIAASTSSNSTGKGGDIIINSPPVINLEDNASITVNSQGEGDGGNIFLTTQNLTLNNQSTISATTASGEGGNIILNVSDTLRQRNNSPISATAGGTGNGGNITIDTEYFIGSENSGITANAFEGNGGNINITAKGIFRDLDSPITASSELGVDGVVQTNTPEVDPSRGLVNLPNNVVDPNTLIAQNVCRKGNQSEFTVRGKGGLPSSPEQLSGDNEIEVNLVEGTQQSSETELKSSQNVTPKERKIIPAQGWVKNEKGEFVLVAYTNENAVNRNVNSPVTCPAN